MIFITGMNPKAKFENIPQQAAVYYTLCFLQELLQLTNSASLRFRIGVSQ